MNATLAGLEHDWRALETEVAGGRLAEAASDRRHEAQVTGVLNLLRVLDKLVDLAELWGSGALFATDRIELWPLLQQVWAEPEPMAIDHGVKERFRAQVEASSLATPYGSEHRLRRVFLECLEGAVRSSRQGATLEIEHRQMGPRALIVLRDCGVFAPRADANAIEMAKAGHKGAPHRNDTSQLDIAQAQQYARDLAALMARARHRGAAKH